MRANLGNADLSPAKLQDADLSAASILKATRRNPSLEPANLDAARLARADLDDSTVTPQDWESIAANTPEVPVDAARRQVLVSLLLTGFSRVLKAVVELEEGLPSTPVGDCLRIFLCLPVVVGIGWVVGKLFGRSIADMTYCLENHRDALLPGIDISRRDLAQIDLSNAELAGANQRETDDHLIIKKRWAGLRSFLTMPRRK
jgi:hypothetical protein